MLNNIPQEQLQPRLQIIVYILAALAVSILMYDQYYQGVYPLVLSNAIAIPALLFSAIFIYINRDRETYAWVNYPLISLLVLLALYQLPDYPQLIIHSLYAVPLFSYFCLPIIHATLFNFLVALAVIITVWTDAGTAVGLRTGTNYLLLVVSAWCFAYLTQLKSESLKRMALTDPESGAYNARHFQHALEREIARSETTRQSVSLIGLVIEDYQQLIDLHGKWVMQQLLPNFVVRAQQQIRAADEVFRLEKDKFVLILPHCPEDGAIVLMERISRNMQTHSWKPVNEIELATAAVSWQAGEDSGDLEKRLEMKLKKQKRASLQLAAFDE
ncbi:GGDEF domain-containing protein [Bacterioplanoides sp.]|uniref:GGDEF domain-containing protein n=1 Tax=Bacterioplanoides sp. TaxID=2066072 RepID=UPI003AFFF0B2